MASDVEIYEPGGCARDCTHGLAVKLVDNDQHSDFQRDQNRACVAALSTYSIYLGNHGDIHELWLTLKNSPIFLLSSKQIAIGYCLGVAREQKPHNLACQ